MTTPTDLTTCQRLARECREDDAAMVPPPWRWFDDTLLWNEEADECVLVHGNAHWPVSEAHRNGIARVRNNLPAIVEALETTMILAARVTSLEAALQGMCSQPPGSPLTDEVLFQVAEGQRALSPDEVSQVAAELAVLRDRCRRPGVLTPTERSPLRGVCHDLMNRALGAADEEVPEAGTEERLKEAALRKLLGDAP